MAEGARLESVFRGNSNVGSNPTLSARISKNAEFPLTVILQIQSAVGLLIVASEQRAGLQRSNLGDSCDRY